MYAIDIRKDQWAFDVEVITPAMASNMLETINVKNRKIRPAVVGRYAEMMQKGHWKLSPEAIVIANTGRLLNGQHRLSAVAKSGVAVRFLVIRGPNEDVFKVLDRGSVRSTSDALQSEKRATEVARLIIGIAYGNTRMITDPAVAQIIGKIGDVHADLMDKCNTTAPMFSSVPFRLAAVARIMSGANPDYVMSMYRDLVLANIDDLPPIGHAIIKMHMTGRASGAGGLANQMKNAGLAWSVFDPQKKNNTRVTHAQSRAFVSDILEAVGYVA